MLYMGIDQHARQITISPRDDGGDVVLARQVSTRPEKIRAFVEKLTRERAKRATKNGSSRRLHTRSYRLHGVWPTCASRPGRCKRRAR